MNELTLNFKSYCGNYSLTFEDNGKVSYAYLKKGNEIQGDVWLYNRCMAPDVSEWSDKKNIPFANCSGFISVKGTITTPVCPSDVLVDWESDENGPVAYIYLFEELIGVVGVHDKPGYSRYAIKNGPVAKVMEIV